MTFAETFLNGRILAIALPRVAEGFVVTVALAALVVLAGLAAGLGLAVVRVFRVRLLNFLIVLAVDLFRALPPLVIIVLIFFGLPGIGLSLSGFATTWLSLTLVLMAFAEEIFWAGILAVPAGQWDAARAMGLRFLPTLLLVVLPQAVRITIPPLTNRTIAIIKGTALGSVVGMYEILASAQSVVNDHYNPSPLLLGSAAYLVLFIPVVAFGRWVETRFAWRR
ncbi:MAG: ABC transporter permease subunit [Acetobacteraceae bacterium]|nr:ABC transporter permease subunit [Acetobacteraceae bacterium]